MNNRFEHLVDCMQERFGSESLEREGDNHVSVLLNDFIILFHYFPDSERILMASCIAPLPSEHRETICLALLQGQYFFHQTAGMTLSVDPGGSFIALQASMDTRTVETGNFIDVVTNFVRVAEMWAHKCTAIGEEQSSAVEDAEAERLLFAHTLRV